MTLKEVAQSILRQKHVLEHLKLEGSTVKQAATILIVGGKKNKTKKPGPAEFSVLPSKPRAIGCDLSKITNAIHQVALPAQAMCWEPTSLF